MIEEVGADNVKAVYDVCNVNVRCSPIPAVEALGKLITLVHICDNDGKTWKKLPVGMGNINFEALFKSLRKVGYKGWSMLEVPYPEDPDKGLAISRDKLTTIGWVT
jgi:sugar phosphate isomerase/epimerase